MESWNYSKESLINGGMYLVDTKCLVLCSIDIEDDGFNEMEVIEDVTDVRTVVDIETDEEFIEYVKDNEKIEQPTEGLEWFSYVPMNSDLANYARNSKTIRYECEWDSNGDVI